MYFWCSGRKFNRGKKVVSQVQEYIQIIKVSNGGISLNDIRKLSYSQYKVIRKAAELEEIKERLSLITDMNAAFHGNKTHLTRLEKTYQNIVGNFKLETALKNEKPDLDWQKRLGRYKR